MANIQPTVDALEQPTVMLQIRKIAGTVDSNLEAVNNEMANIQEQIDQMEDVSGRVTTLENEMDTVQSDLTAVENKNTEQDSAISENEKGLITASELTYSEGVLTLKLTKQNGDLTETVDVPFFKTVTLIPTSTERAFKLQFTMWDDSVYDTNEFVIPAGGGTDVSVTGVTVGEGASDNTFKVSIQLSDASTIASNDYPFPASVTNPYPTAVSGTVGDDGNITLTIIMSSGSPLTTTINMNHFASTADLSDLQEQVTGIKPTVTTNLESSPPTITVAVNGTSSTANLPSGRQETAHYFSNLSQYNSVMNAIPEGTEFEIYIYCSGRYATSGTVTDTVIAYSGRRIASPANNIIGSGGGQIYLNGKKYMATFTYGVYSESDRDIEFWYLFNNNGSFNVQRIGIHDLKEITTLLGIVKY